MAFGGLTCTVDLYIRRQDELTQELGDILSDITRESKKSTKLSEKTRSEKAAVREEYEAGSDGYKDAMAEIDDEYQYELAKITAWESELQEKKENIEVQVKAITIFKEDFQKMAQKNAQTDNTWGGGTGG